MKRLHRWALLLLTMLLAVGCGSRGPQKYTGEFYGTFDTRVQVTAYSESQQEFEAFFQQVEQRMNHYSQLYDIYTPYQGVQGIYQLNAQAGAGPVAVAPEVVDLLLFAQQCYEQTQGRVNVALGRVLALWHDLRTQANQDPKQASLPTRQALEDAAQHCNMGDMLIDAAAGTVELKDPLMRLDVGSIAKGYGVQRVTQELLDLGYRDFVISAGGNVEARGTPMERAGWSVGIADPQSPQELLTTVEVADKAVVTSGGYERFYTVDGQRYHHIVDPATLEPAQHMLAATVICPDSALADCYSTAFFLMEPQQALALAKQMPELRLILVTLDGQVLDSGESD